MSNFPPDSGDPDATAMAPNPGRRDGAIDPDATAVVPTPGRRRAPAPPAVQSSTLELPSAAMSRDFVGVDLGVMSGINPLVAAANPLFALVPQIRSTLNHPDPGGFREGILRQIAIFEQTATARAVKPESVSVARYALCTLIDETVATTPWGGTAEWMKESLLVTLYRENWGGEKFFQLLNKMAEQPSTNLDLLELFYVCLALGFEGRFRIIEGGKAQLQELRDRLFELIRKHRPADDSDLSLRWKGIETKVRKVSNGLALWLTVAACLLVLVGAYLGYLFSLSNQAGPLKSELAQMKVKIAVARSAPPTPNVPRLSKFLADEINKGLVVVFEDDQVSVVTIPGDGLFASGSATLEGQAQNTFARIAQALDSVPGPVIVTGHTDDKPIRSARFPSNWELSKERATSAVKLMAGSMKEPGRMRAEGMADSDPVAANDTEENRKKNRRVMVILKVANS